MATYKKDIAHCVDKLINKPVSVVIKSYDDDDNRFFDKINDTFICATYDDIPGCYLYLKQRRNELSKEISFDLNDKEFRDNAVEFVNSVYRLFNAYFSRNDRCLYMADRNLIKKIMQADIRQNGDGTLSVGLGNPLILESLIVAESQLKKFCELFPEKKGRGVDEKTKEATYREHLYRKIDALFFGMDLVFDGKPYGIVGYDVKDNVFIASEDDACRDQTPISAVSLYGDIARAAEAGTADPNGDASGYRALIVGDTASDSMDVLKKMTESLGVKIESNPREACADGNFSKSRYDDISEEYDDVYILDCPDIYVSSAYPRQDDFRDRRALMRSRAGEESDLTESDFERSFYGVDAFAELYYSVQTNIFGLPRKHGRAAKVINRPFFDYVMKTSDRGHGFIKSARMSVYVPDGTDLDDYTDDGYGAVCTEVNSRNGYKVFETGPETGILPSTEKKLKMTYLDVLTAMSSSYEFYCGMTDVRTTGVTMADDVAEAVKRAYETKIEICYRTVRDGDDGEGKVLDVYVGISYGPEGVSEEYEETVEATIREMFAVRDAGSLACVESVVGRSLSECHKKAMGALIHARAENFEDMMFYHLYAGEGENVDEIRFSVQTGPCEPDSESRASSDDDAGDVPVYPGKSRRMRFSKHVAEYLMNNMDDRYYRESSIVEYLRMVGSVKSKLDGYTNNLKVACRDLGYTDSLLCHRLEKYF